MRNDRAFFLVAYSFAMFFLGMAVGYLISEFHYYSRKYKDERSHRNTRR